MKNLDANSTQQHSQNCSNKTNCSDRKLLQNNSLRSNFYIHNLVSFNLMTTIAKNANLREASAFPKCHLPTQSFSIGNSIQNKNSLIRNSIPRLQFTAAKSEFTWTKKKSGNYLNIIKLFHLCYHYNHLCQQPHVRHSD